MGDIHGSSASAATIGTKGLGKAMFGQFGQVDMQGPQLRLAACNFWLVQLKGKQSSTKCQVPSTAVDCTLCGTTHENR